MRQWSSQEKWGWRFPAPIKESSADYFGGSAPAGTAQISTVRAGVSEVFV